MRRIRTVKPEWLEDERIAAADDETRVASIALLLIADDHGRGKAHPKYLASEMWKYAEDTRESLAKVSRALASLSALGFVDLYEVDGQSYFEIVNWAKHQRVDKPSKARIPARLGASQENPRETLASPRETLASPRETLATDQDQDQDRGARSEDQGDGTGIGDPITHRVARALDPDAELRGALVRGYREAFEARFGTSPTDASGSMPGVDACVDAIRHRAKVTGHRPDVVARMAGSAYIRGREWDGDHRRLPKWRFFLADLGALLVDLKPGDPIEPAPPSKPPALRALK